MVMVNEGHESVEDIISSLAPKKKRRKKGERYFTDDTEAAIIEYNNCEDDVERNKIYAERIYKPLMKMAENIIHTKKFYYMNMSMRDAQQGVVAHLTEKLSYYKQTEGRAFSYFTRTALNFCIIENNKNYYGKQQITELDEIDNQRDLTSEYYSNSIDTHSEFISKLIAYWEWNYAKHFSSKIDIRIADAVIELFRKKDSLELFNKKGLYIMIRDMTGAKTPDITRVIKTMKLVYKELYKEYYNTGTIKI